ncbi:hypothetical protein DFS33DRAFT_1280134 [Desarmillaria ectypa]|nr:hypothetical protein DFS33DRAFT_1280134 [Desarmillaria ectypa]
MNRMRTVVNIWHRRRMGFSRVFSSLHHAVLGLRLHRHVDLHSHIGTYGSYASDLTGTSDTKSFNGITQPWLRNLDRLNTHDDAYRLSISGGLTTALILPGSANDKGAFNSHLTSMTCGDPVLCA